MNCSGTMQLINCTDRSYSVQFILVTTNVNLSVQRVSKQNVDMVDMTLSVISSILLFVCYCKTG